MEFTEFLYFSQFFLQLILFVNIDKYLYKMQLKQLFGNQSNANDNKSAEQKQEKKELTDSFVTIEESKPNIVDLENDFVSIEESILSLSGIISEDKQEVIPTTVQGTIDGLYQDQHYEIPRSILPKESKFDSYTQSVLDVNSKPYSSPIEGNPHVIVQEAKSNVFFFCKFKLISLDWSSNTRNRTCACND